MGEVKEKYSDLLPRIISALPKEEENAIFQKDLAKQIGIAPTLLKKAIRYARQQGVDIISGIHGYYLTDDEEIKKRFIRTMSRQAKTRFSSIATMKKTVDDDGIIGQMSLDEISEKGDGDNDG